MELISGNPSATIQNNSCGAIDTSRKIDPIMAKASKSAGTTDDIATKTREYRTIFELYFFSFIRCTLACSPAARCRTSTPEPRLYVSIR
ncbi:MAG: hypothetical protein J4432_04670 [DPANN group archaeon]|nr:hypothetical protein [DPANN group archaeon]